MQTNRLTKDHASFRIKIVDAASQLFADNGFEAASMDDLAASIGTSKPRIYDEFASKQLVFEAVIERAILNFDLYWVAAAARREISFAAFMERLPAEIMMIMSSPKRFQLLWFLLREGQTIEKLSPTHYERMLACLALHWDELLVSAMRLGECRRMDPNLARRLLVAPFNFVVFQYIALGSTRIGPAMTAAFLEENYRILGESLILPGPSEATQQQKNIAMIGRAHENAGPRGPRRRG